MSSPDNKPYSRRYEHNNRNTMQHHQICAAIVLSIVLFTMPHDTCARPDIGRYRIAHQDVPPLLHELMANEDALFAELVKYHRKQPNYLTKWPGLSDLLLIADYDDNDPEKDEILNMLFLNRLRELAANLANRPIMEDVREESVVANGRNRANAVAQPMADFAPLSNNFPDIVTVTGEGFKDHGKKKSVQARAGGTFMAPCHFKICNLGK